MQVEEFLKLKEALFNHQVIALPTETVYGLAVLYDDKIAFDTLVKIKLRRPDKPFTLMLAKVEDIEKFAILNDLAKILIKHFLPGEITLLLNAREDLPWQVTLGTSKIGIRVSGDETLRNFIEYVSKPLLVPSANKADMPPALSEEEVRLYFKEDEVKEIASGKIVSKMPSTIVDVSDNKMKIIRLGKIKETEIKEVLTKYDY